MFGQVPKLPVDRIDVDSLLRDNTSSTAFFESPVAIQILLLNLVVGLTLSLILQWHYRRFATTLSSKENFSKVFPLILLTTILIITIVKSSLALSLGLVGALSIVRFRTPIKEPEELAYLFICIAIGLGLGASQTLATVTGAGFTFLAVGLMAASRRAEGKKNLYLSVNWPRETKDPAAQIDALNTILSEHVNRCDLRRVDSRDDLLEAHYCVELSSANDLTLLMDRLRTGCKVDVTFVDQSNLPSA